TLVGERRGRNDLKRGIAMSERVRVVCTENGRAVEAKVLSRSPRRLLVSLALGPGERDIELVLTRDGADKPYAGRLAGLEFTVAAK
ncbi:MAG TPA: hypothetical protein VLG66_08310, partial [Alphaproteobacteria bacterium]|nr:hypothetical protein [Alphaproteobacteria bacterium]